MRLTPNDEDKINVLKKRYGFTQSSDLIRYLLTNTIEQLQREKTLSVHR